MNQDPDVNPTSSPLAAAKAVCKEVAAKVEEVKLTITKVGAKPFKLYSNLLSGKVR